MSKGGSAAGMPGRHAGPNRPPRQNPNPNLKIRGTNGISGMGGGSWPSRPLSRRCGTPRKHTRPVSNPNRGSNADSDPSPNPNINPNFTHKELEAAQEAAMIVAQQGPNHVLSPAASPYKQAPPSALASNSAQPSSYLKL